ncbi:cation diffusion facilitator family transporter [Ancylobacter terrae]|uniref:cation diffusion facilitator family transporter n=1 Tax=Ancylobacter sp. sgz301288 TaxID=3342077 RepID=UPI00385EA34D
MNRSLKLAIGSVVVGCVVLALKYLAYRMTGSVALYSDALESIVNVATSLAAVVAIYMSSKPADAIHPYGYAKAEYFSAVLEGVLIVVAALSIFREAYFAFLEPRMIDAPWRGILVNAGAGVLNGLWCAVLLREGRRMRSPALVADGKHLLTDVVSSAGVLVGVTLAAVTGWHVLDPALAALVALNIIWAGWNLMKESLGGLMDRAVPDDILTRIRTQIAREAIGAIEAHDVRTRQAGRMTFVDFHLVVPGEMPVREAHAICDRIEDALRSEVDDILINIHVEPEGKAKHAGIPVL